MHELYLYLLQYLHGNPNVQLIVLFWGYINTLMCGIYVCMLQRVPLVFSIQTEGDKQ